MDFEVLKHVTGCGTETVLVYVHGMAKAICQTLGIYCCETPVNKNHVPWWQLDASTAAITATTKGGTASTSWHGCSSFIHQLTQRLGMLHTHCDSFTMGDLFLTSYSNPMSKKQADFNFCISSTSFFIQGMP
eukprot:1639945-Rhodomonas_salina.1